MRRAGPAEELARPAHIHVSVDELRERAARFYRLEPENVLVGNGSDELLAILMRATIDAGERVAYPVPVGATVR